MEFREWLLKEDPDEVIIGNTSLDWESGITFSLFDNFFVYAKEDHEVVHLDIISEIASCRDALEKCMSGTITPKEVSDCINDADGPAATNALIDTHGIPSRRAVQLMLLVVDSTHGAVAPRIVSLKTAPDVIHGRIWIESKVVSFWNTPFYIHRNKSHILEFVRVMAGQEQRFRYEVENNLLDYDAFLAGSNRPGPAFDPSKVHTMVPGPEKTQMMGAMGFMRSKPVDIRGKAVREGD